MISACASRRRVASTNAPTGLEGPRDRELAASLALPAPFHGAEQKNTLRVRVAARVCRVSDTCPGVHARRQSGVISCVCRVRRRRRRGRGPRCDCKRYFLWREARSASVGSLVPRLLQAGRSSSQLCGCCVIGRVSAGKGGARRGGLDAFFSWAGAASCGVGRGACGAQVSQDGCALCGQDGSRCGCECAGSGAEFGCPTRRRSQTGASYL